MANIRIIQFETGVKTEVRMSSHKSWMKVYPSLPSAAKEAGSLGLIPQTHSMILQRENSGDGVDIEVEDVDEGELSSAGFIETQNI
jgi:hypothetical protein